MWGAEWVALPNVALSRQANWVFARGARLAAAILPDLQGAGGRAVQDADRQAGRAAAYRAASPKFPL